MFNKNIDRRFYKILKATFARILILKKRKDIYYRYTFKAANEIKYIIRKYGVKSSSFKNDIRYIKNTITFKYKVAAIIFQQTNCL